MGDRFRNSNQLHHASNNGMNVCYWDGSTQFVDLTTHPIPWNGTDGEGGRVFSFNTSGTEAVRDAWAVLSQGQK